MSLETLAAFAAYWCVGVLVVSSVIGLATLWKEYRDGR